jgi:hypothetical protein
LVCSYICMTFALRIVMQLYKDPARHRLVSLHPILRALYSHLVQDGIPKKDTSMPIQQLL